MNSYSKQSINTQDIKAVSKALRASVLTGGKTVREFEEQIAQYLGVKYALSFSSCTTALIALYSALDLNNTEFITSPMSFVATANAGIMAGARPIFCDILPNGQIDAAKISKVLTPKTKAIVAVDYSGNVADLAVIKLLAKKYNLAFIQDSAHSFGTKINKKSVASFADANVFSFHPVKPITTIEGGAVTTNDKVLFERLMLIRSHGIKKGDLWEQDMVLMGANYRLSDVAASLGLSQLKRLDKFLEKRNAIADYYDLHLGQIEELSIIKLTPNITSTRHLYPLLLGKKLSGKKVQIFKRMQELGLGVQVHYKPIVEMTYYKNLGYKPLQNAHDFYTKELSIACHHKMSKKDAQKSVQIIKKIIKEFNC